MYEAFYKLTNDPFRLLPDPEVCYPHRSCAKAWAYLRYALKRGEGIVVITGPPGSGKTTLAERLLKDLNPSKTVSVKLIANDLNPIDLLRKLAYSFGLPAEGMDRAMLAHRIERYLIQLEHGKRQVLVLIDEAQTLSHQSLEAMRLLTDLQSRSRPVMQLFLLGQEDLEGVMSAPGMTQFQQRVIASCRLHRMDLAETKAYLEYRLAFADWTGDPSINGSAVMAIFRGSRGLPRHINKICSRLLLHGCAEEKHALKKGDVQTVVQDLRDELLTPLEGEGELVVDVSGSTIGSVYELALVPAPRAAKQTSNNAMDALFLAEESAAQTAQDVAHQAKDHVERGAHRRHTGGRYAYRVGFPRPHRFRRWVHRLSRLPRIAFGYVREWTRKWAPMVTEHLMRAGRKAAANAMYLGRLAGRWVRGRTPVPGVLSERMRSLPNIAIAGLSGLLIFGLAFATWDRDADTERGLIRGDSRASGSQGSEFLADEVIQGKSPLLDGASRNLDAASMPPTQGEPVSNSSNSSGVLVQEMVRPDTLDHHDVLKSDATKALPGQVIDKVPEPERVAVQQVSAPVVAPVAGLPESTASDAANIRLVSGYADESESSGLASDQQGTGDKITLNVVDTSGVAPDDVDGLPVSASGASMPDSSAEADTAAIATSLGNPSPESETEETVPPAQIGDDLVLRNVTEASSSDQRDMDMLTDRQREIEQALVLAEMAMDKDHLLTPAENNAYGYYQRVLEIDALNEDAQAGIARIVQRYRILAKWALQRKSFEKAGSFLERGLRLDSDNVRLLALQGELNDSVAEAEAAKLSRMALEMKQPKPVVELPQPRDSNYNTWMRAADGL